MAAVEVASDELIGRLDSAVSEVFEMMLDRSCGPMEEAGAIEEPISAAIRFSGAVEKECLFYASRSVAQVTAEALLGTVSERTSDGRGCDWRALQYGCRRMEEQAGSRAGLLSYLSAHCHCVRACPPRGSAVIVNRT